MNKVHVLVETFEFAHDYLNENSCMLIIAQDVEELREDNPTYAKTYEFNVAKDWWQINELALCSRVNWSLRVNSIPLGHYLLSCYSSRLVQQCIF